jgi:hypothetical protein
MGEGLTGFTAGGGAVRLSYRDREAGLGGEEGFYSGQAEGVASGWRKANTASDAGETVRP